MIYHVQGEHDNRYTTAAVYKNNYKAKKNKFNTKTFKDKLLVKKSLKIPKG